jgi:hypothetical protein
MRGLSNLKSTRSPPLRYSGRPVIFSTFRNFQPRITSILEDKGSVEVSRGLDWEALTLR